LPALAQLLPTGVVASVGMTERENEFQSIVKGLCAQHQIPLTLFKKKTFSTDILEWLVQYEPQTVLVKTFPWMIPAAALTKPVHGFINFHYAPLPEFRGANPIFWMIRNQVPAAGVTVHQMDEGMDTGPVILQKNFPLPAGTTFGMACTQLAYAGVEL